MKKRTLSSSQNWYTKIEFKKDIPYFTMLIIPIAFFVIFKYWPMFGLVISFQNYKAGSPFIGPNVDWVGLKWFRQFFNYPFAGRLIRNTVLLSFYSIVSTFVLSILLALLLNEIQNKRFRKLTTTLSFLPHFISTTVVVGMLTNFLNINDGIVNRIIVALGGTAKDFMGSSEYFRPLYVLSGIWQNVGFEAIVFSAAIAGIDPGLYEAAYVDGSTRPKNIFHITLPSIMPTIVIMLILKVGNIMAVGYEKVILMYSERIYETADVLSTYSYRNGIVDGKWSYSTAIGLFNSVVGLIIVFIANKTADKMSGSSLW